MQFDKDSPVGKLEQFGKKMEEAGKKMEAAQKSGNQDEAMKAAMAGLERHWVGVNRLNRSTSKNSSPWFRKHLPDSPKNRGVARKTACWV